MYEVLFDGQLVEGFDPAQVRSNLKALFKASDEQVERMFASGAPVILRNRLDETTARKYEIALKRAGAVVSIRHMAGETAGAAASPAGSAASGTTSGAAAGAAANASASSASSATQATHAVQGSSQEPETPPLPEVTEVSEEDQAQEVSRIDEILKGVDWNVLPVGSRIGDPTETVASPISDLSAINWDLAPVGSDMGQLPDEKEPVAPDISHLSLKENKS